MARIDHVAPYFMPLVCSNRTSIVTILFFIIISILLSVYALSFLLANEYNDPNMFTPNAQDYFRTSLLGFVSPFLFYFLKTFVFNISPKFLLINLFFDFPLNDSFLLCILIGLAYPQLQDQVHHQQTDNPDPPPLWHIIPRQSYIFGLNWALAELIISILGNLPYYKEISLKGTFGNIIDSNIIPDNDYINVPEDEENLLNRNNITLSRCVGLRRISSTISSNVYSSELGISPKRNSNYGTISSGKTHSNRSKSNRNNGDAGSHNAMLSNNIMNNQDVKDTNSVLVIDPKDNSLRLTSLDTEQDFFDHDTVQPTFTKRNGYVWVTVNEDEKTDKTTPTESNNNSSDTITKKPTIQNSNRVRYYCEIQNNRYLVVRFLRVYLIFLGNIFLTIGESFILSIYFIYVRGHEGLFTDIVNYFGSRSLLHFLLYVVIPFLTLDYLVSIIILFWNDMENVYGVDRIDKFNKNTTKSRSQQNDALFQTERFYFDLYARAIDSHDMKIQTDSSIGNGTMTDSITDTPLNYLREPSLLEFSNATFLQANQYKKRKPLRRLTRLWQKLSIRSCYVTGMEFFWGLLVFGAGIYTAADFK